MKLINLTPHKINITGYGDIEPSGIAVRSHSHLMQTDMIEGVPVMTAEHAGVSNLPDPKRGVMYIVPSHVRECLPDRGDIASPCKLIRNSVGHVVGCGALQVNKSYKVK
jgi:hypothetical protein